MVANKKKRINTFQLRNIQTIPDYLIKLKYCWYFKQGFAESSREIFLLTYYKASNIKIIAEKLKNITLLS